MNRTELEKAKDYAYKAYCDENIQLDEAGINPSEGEDGCWVAAWLWVPRDEYALVQRRDEEVRDA